MPDFFHDFKKFWYYPLRKHHTLCDQKRPLINPYYASAQLNVECAIYISNSFQLDGLFTICTAYPKTQRDEDTPSEDEISHQIIGASIEVHRTLGGPGLLESIYEAVLCHELILRGLHVHRQKPVQVVTKEWQLESLYLSISSLKIKYLLRLRRMKKSPDL